MNGIKKLTSSDCAQYLGLPLIGGSVEIKKVAGIGADGSGILKFVSVFDEKIVAKLNQYPQNFVIAHDLYKGLLLGPHVISKNPRLDFCRLTKHFFPNVRNPAIERSAIIGDKVSLGEGVYIGHNVVIEDNVIIGDHTSILHNVVISSGSEIGSNCLIKSGAVIGQKGFGFERDESGIPVEFTHYGRVIIGSNVEIGALTTVVAGALSDTILDDYVKVDDHVHIAHNVVIGWGSMITACAEISGSVQIGKQAWLGPNCSIIDKAVLGDDAFVGIGAVVIKSFPEKSVIVGNPGKLLRVTGS